MTGAIVQNEFHHRRKVYSKTLTTNVSTREDNGTVDVLLGTPAAVDLEPPKDSYANYVLVEEVDDPEAKTKEVRKMGMCGLLGFTCFHFLRTTNGHGPTTTS